MANTKDIPTEFQDHCAVAGDLLDTRIAEKKGLVAEYEGKKYYFCCPPCKAPFLANPENYTAGKKEIIALAFAGKQHISDNVWSFSFTSQSPVHWLAGQYLRLVVPHDEPDEKGTKRWFTISSAPYENVITITTRVSDSTYKQALHNLRSGDKATIVDLPGGDFIWETDDNIERVFAVGGIGITPFYSIAKQRVHDGKPLNATLVYANRTDEIPFRNILDDLSQNGLETQYINGGELTADTIASAARTAGALFYISGAKPMVEQLAEGLKQRGIAADRIISDAFSRYTMENY